MFKIYFEIGLHHILDISAYDHILFILALCAIYTLKDWRKILVLVTAFTLGHCTTLVLASLNVINLDRHLVEKLIPITIIITALVNILIPIDRNKNSMLHYIMACGFGLIHGLAFSSTIKTMLSEGESLVISLLGFNIGVEIGLNIIVVIGFLLNYIWVFILKLKATWWNYLVSGVAILVSGWMMVK